MSSSMEPVLYFDFVAVVLPLTENALLDSVDKNLASTAHFKYCLNISRKVSNLMCAYIPLQKLNFCFCHTYYFGYCGLSFAFWTSHLE